MEAPQGGGFHLFFYFQPGDKLAKLTLPQKFSHFTAVTLTKTRSNLVQFLYFLPLWMLASFVTVFSVDAVASRTFVAECHNKKSPYRFYDFCVHFAGGQIAGSKDRARLYDTGVQQVYVGELHGPVPLSSETLLMKSAPFLPCLLIPLAMLPIATAFDLYFLGCLASYFGGFYLLTRLRPNKPKPFTTLLMAWAFVGTVPVFTTALLGQISTYLFFIVCAYFYCLCKNKNKLAGILLALSSFKPHYALFWAIPALGLKRWSVIIAAIITELALLAMAVAILGWQAVVNYPAAIVNGDNIALWSEVGILMISLRGILFSICNSPIWLPVSVLFVLIGQLILFFIWRRYMKAIADSSSQTKSNSNSKSNSSSTSDSSSNTSSTPRCEDFPAENWQSYRWLFGTTVILCLFCAAHAYIYDAILLTIAGIFCVDLDWSDSWLKRTKAERFIQIMLLATPYIQWLGLLLLPTNYHRSLPTSLTLMVLSITAVLQARQRAQMQADSVAPVAKK